jgi:excisionase family DNA binding protein
MSGDKLLLKVDEAADRLSIKRTLFYEMLRRGEIASITIGARRLVPVSALEEFVRSRLEQEAPPAPGPLRFMEAR